MYKYLLFLLLLTGCKSTDASITPEAEAYIDEVITIMQANSVNKGKIDWKDFRLKVKNHAVNAKSIADTYPSIHYAIKLLGDGHSYIAPVNDNDESDDKEPPVLLDEKVPNDIGYVRVSYCMGSDEQKERYVNKLIEDIKQRDSENLKGWVVDLRGNFGGDMSPMLLAIGPILGDGIIGYTMYPDKKTTSWNYSNGEFYFEKQEGNIKAKEKYTLKKRNPYVAVLTDTLTASSGEAVTVAFKGRSKTKSFGWKTYGVSTSNEGFTLSDGSRMLLTVAVFADRNKYSYGGPVIPDEEVDPDKSLSKAIEWLRASSK
jgi:C-terminal processing protease CtpA/Prc